MTLPVITSNGGLATATISLAENIAAVTTVISIDPDVGATQTYSIVGGVDAALFSIVAGTGVLTFIGAPDFESPIGADNSYEVTVRVTDNTAAIDEQTITVNITNVNEAPVITSDGGGSAATIFVAENTTAITTVTSTDQDAGATKTFSLNGGADAGLFTIDATTGVLSFIASKNFEVPGDVGANNIYDVIVRVSDGTNTDQQTIQVMLHNVNEAPVITSNGGGATANISIAENQSVVTTVTSTDVDAVSVRTYSLSGADAARFVIHPTTGVLRLVAPLDFETPVSVIGADNIYDVTVTVTDGELTDTQALLVTITNTGDVVITGTSGADTINGVVTVAGQALATAAEDIISSGDGIDAIAGLGGNDKLDGGTGADTMTGGLGNDFYVVDNATDMVVEAAGEGTDIVQSSVSHTLAADVEDLHLVGSAILGTGNALANIITGNSLSNTLNGMAGADLMVGGAGNDTYVVDNIGDAVAELAGEGSDTVQSSIAFTLGANFDDLTLTGAAVINGTGNSLDNDLTGNGAVNTLTGNAGNDVINGGLGADIMIGGFGNDTYFYDGTDTVTEINGEGEDTMRSDVNATLAANVEVLILSGSSAINGTGTALANELNGNTKANVLTGLAGNDTLNGFGGADTMIGGLNDDRYFVDDVGDVVTELNETGVDTVNSSVTHTLGNFIEKLTLTGVGVINGTGNGSANTMFGNIKANTLTGLGGSDILDGGLGADTMVGGALHDIYYTDDAGDITTETFGDGIDTVASYITTTLQANVENLLILRAVNMDGTGNDLDNALTGGQGNNILTGLGGNDTINGKAGADSMIGGLGDDTYTVDNVGDTVTELTGEGTDTVNTTVSFTLTTGVDHLTLTGAGGRSGTGNDLANTLTGNAGNNALSGMDGNDTISGGSGFDTLTGGNGVDILTGGASFDTFDFNAVTESGLTVDLRDTIMDFTSGDKIDVSGIDADTVLTSDQAFVLDADGSFSNGEIKIETLSGNTIVSFNNDADAPAEMTILIIGLPTLTAADFVL